MIREVSWYENCAGEVHPLSGVYISISQRMLPACVLRKWGGGWPVLLNGWVILIVHRLLFCILLSFRSVT